MLGKHLTLDNPVFNSYVGESASQQIPYLGTVGAIHIDTLALSWLCMGGILLFAAAVKPSLVKDGPGGTGQAVSEGIYAFVKDLAQGQIGKDYKAFLPLIAGIFIFVLVGNLIGIGPWKALEYIPGWPTLGHGAHVEHWEIASPTTDFNVTFGLAIISLFVYLGAGLAKHGGAYVKELLFNPVEWLDLVIRPSTLALRLLLVITADEITRMVALKLVPFIIAPVGVMAFEMFIALIQAFVFALLTGIYIGMAVADHH